MKRKSFGMATIFLFVLASIMLSSCTKIVQSTQMLKKVIAQIAGKHNLSQSDLDKAKENAQEEFQKLLKIL